MNSFFGPLMNGMITGPDALINSMGPLPSLDGAPMQFHAGTHAQINDRARLLEGGLMPYTYGPSKKTLTTQTQNNIPNKKQTAICRLFLPAVQSDGTAQDPVLEHALSDGDVAFSLRMSSDMLSSALGYAVAPRAAVNAVQLINLTTVNYLLWGLQVGAELPNGSQWVKFFKNLCKLELVKFNGKYTMEIIFNFLRSYIFPYGVMHGSDTSGGLHEGNNEPFIINSEYMAAFGLEGKLINVMNLWRAHDVGEDDDLVLQMRFMPAQATSIAFNLSSSTRATRLERAPVPIGWWYLDPVVLKYKTYIDVPHIHIGRSQKRVSAYNSSRFGLDLPPWNARACVLGVPLQMTFEACYYRSDSMWLKFFADVTGEQDNQTEQCATTSSNKEPPRATLMHSYTGKRLVNNSALASPVPLAAPPLSSPLILQQQPVVTFQELMDGNAAPPAKRAKKSRSADDNATVVTMSRDF